jgi:ubiquinone/menaquinone biosynthesis C-methylase UbiE
MNYSDLWISQKAVDSYARKFNSKIDKLRHAIELEIIRKFAKGKLFDCSIGEGRFIKELRDVEYWGADYSPYFVDYIRKNYPDVSVIQNDLRKGIPYPDDSFDTVICIRTLNNLSEKDEIISEMVRVAKKNGNVIFNLPGCFDGYTVKFPLDSFFARSIKKSSFLGKFFNSGFNLIPLNIWVKLEKILLHVSYSSSMIIIKKL